MKERRVVYEVERQSFGGGSWTHVSCSERDSMVKAKACLTHLKAKADQRLPGVEHPFRIVKVTREVVQASVQKEEATP